MYQTTPSQPSQNPCAGFLGGRAAWFLLALFCVLSAVNSGKAAVIVWANTRTDFNNRNSWIGGNLPGAADVASFTAANPIGTVIFASNLFQVSGLYYASGSGAYTLSATSGAARVLELGTGIESDSANTQTFTGGTFRIRAGADISLIGNGGGLVFESSMLNLETNGFRVTLSGTGTTNRIDTTITGTGGITKTGSGIWTLNGLNTYTGSTDIGGANQADGGTLRLGANNVLPGSALNIYGGTLDLNTRTGSVGTITLGGGAAGTSANITGTTGTLTLAGNINYVATNNADGATVGVNLNLGGANRTITAADSTAAATDLTVGAADYSDTITMGANSLTVDGAGNILINAQVGAVGDTGGFIKNGTGTTTFAGDRNNYTCQTTVNNGTLVLDTLNTNVDETIRGNLVIGDGVGAADSATVRYGSGLAHNKIANTSQVTINSDGVLDLNSNDDTIGSFVLSGGHITTGTGVLTLNGNVTTNASAQSATIDGVLSLGNATRTFTVADGAAASDLTVNSAINFGSIIKSGAGTMTITSDNTIGYGGTTAVNQGVLNIQNSMALGQTGVNDAAKGTTVASGAALQVQGGIAVGTEALTISGTGVANTGALRNISGNNSWAGSVSLGAASRVNSDAGTLTLNGAITANNQNLTVGGAGNTTINGAIGTGTGTLTKDGAGTLTLAGNNTYSGATTISSGVVNIRHNQALGSTVSGTTVASGAALQLQDNISVGNEALSLSGTGVANTGALRNLSGNNTWAGGVTIGAAGTRIGSDAGLLTLSNTVGLGTNALTVGGAGNVTISGQLTGSGTLTKAGAGTLTLSNGTNTFSGDILAAAGTLAMGANNALNSSAIDMTVSAGATVSLVSYAQNIGSLSGAGLIDFGTGGVMSLAGTSTFSGSFTGTGELIVGVGAVLTLGADFVANNLTITLAGGTLNLGSNDHSFAALNITQSSILDFAGGASTLQIGSVSFGDLGDILTVNAWTDAVDFFTTPTSPGIQGAAPLNQIVFNGFSGNDTKWLAYDTQITPVPEP
jgi:fibronectin-binding autotransporter adhesin